MTVYLRRAFRILFGIEKSQRIETIEVIDFEPPVS
jgi:hypothetical protein